MQTLDTYFRDLTAKVFARHGAAAAELMIRWPEIVGADLAALAEPVKIVWPRAAKDGERKSGGTLHLRAAAGRALEIPYAAPHLTQRINGYFGYGAIAAVKLVGGTMTPKPKSEPPLQDPTIAAEVESRLTGVADEALKQALQRLGEGVWRSAQAQNTGWNRPKTSIRETP